MGHRPPPPKYAPIPAPLCEVIECREHAANVIRMDDGLHHRCPRHTSRYNEVLVGPGAA